MSANPPTELNEDEKRQLELLTQGLDGMLLPEIAELIGEVKRSVAYLALAFDGNGGQGTGFLIRSDLLLTNYHVVVNRKHGEATGITANFDKDDGFKGTPLILKGLLPPIALNQADDWAVIRLERPVTDRTPIALGTKSPLLKQEPIVIIQHPGDRSKRLSVGRLTIFDDRVTCYSADTLEGSSGAPVFNREMHCIGLHHEGVSTEDGKKYNEGIRIERVMEGLRAADQPFDDDAVGFIARLKAQLARRGGGSTPPRRISLTHLPETGPDLFGREAELALLDAAWKDESNNQGKTNIVTLVAAGGTGKTALAKHWLARMAADGWRGATHVLGWSFYSQGAREDGGASADPFIDYGLRWFGDEDPTKGSPWEKGERLAAYFAAARSLLVLDGMEPLQYPPGVEHAGRVRDPALAALLATLAYGNAGLCVITTREPVADVTECIGQTVIEVDLRHLNREAAIAYLRQLGVNGDDDELAEAAAAFGGHALALTLLGTLLRDFCEGDVRRWREAGPLEEEPEKGTHAGHVMATYERWLGEGPERAILRMVGLFDRPAGRA